MGYIDGILGDKERVVLQTHQHVMVLVRRLTIPFLALLVLVALGLAALLAAPDVRRTVGLVAYVAVLWPVYVMLAAYVRGARGTDLLGEIWIPVLGAVLIVVVAAILGTVDESHSPPLIAVGALALVVALVPLGVVIQGLLKWLNERYIITNRRVMELTGIINKHVRDSALEKVNDVDMTQSILGRVLRYGTVQIITGSDIGLNRFQSIANPVRFKRVMLNQKEALGILDGHAATGHDSAKPATAPADIPALIASLDDLRRQGALTDEEFEAKKRELLSRLA